MSTILSQLKPLKIGDLTAKLPIIQGGMGHYFHCPDRFPGAGFCRASAGGKPTRDRFRVAEGARDREGRHRGL